MEKEEVARVLSEIGTLLELQGENPFRCNAYHNAARAIEQLSGSLAAIVAQGELASVKGIGETLRDKITSLVQTGKLEFHDELRAKTPPGLLDMLRIGGLGPKKVKTLFESLGVDTLAKLELACREDQVAGLKGFGAKTQQKILEGLEFLGKTMDRVRIDQAMGLCSSIMEQLKECQGIQRIEPCGSLRRRKETIKDIDLLVCSEDAGPIMKRFVGMHGVAQVLGQGETKSSVLIEATVGGSRITLQADLRVVRPEAFPFALSYFTGSKDHNVALRARAQARGLRLNEYELAGPKGKIDCGSEEEIYQALGLTYIEPELREMTGEIQAAEEGALPELVRAQELQGVFHCHTTWSDGTASVLDMAEAAKKLGYRYFGIGDHSQSLTVANGLTLARVVKQQAEIDEVNRRLKGMHVFKGTECDILPDGRLDYNDQELARFDYVVASVHTHFNLSREEMTQRIITALSHPAVTMLGHSTGRLLLRREGYKVDLEAVLQAAAKHRKMIEINAHPQRLDLDWIHCKRAKELGVLLVINPDAHGMDEIALTRFGVDVARRGWISKDQIFNTRSLAEVKKYFAAKRATAGPAEQS